MEIPVEKAKKAWAMARAWLRQRLAEGDAEKRLSA
jgi:hypothetical protein